MLAWKEFGLKRVPAVKVGEKLRAISRNYVHIRSTGPIFSAVGSQMVPYIVHQAGRIWQLVGVEKHWNRSTAVARE